MSDLITHTARLVPYAKRPKQVPSFVTAYSYEPIANEPGAELGNLYVVMEVLVSGRASEEVADLVIETIGDQYYNQPRENRDALGQFEAAIKAVNHELGDYVNRGNAAWIGKLSTAVAVQVGAEVHVAQTGSAEAFLYRGKAATQICSKEPNRPTTPTKTFGSIATGQLEPGDRLLLATPALIHQIPLEKLKSIIIGSGPNTAISEVTELLKGTSVDRIAALIIEITTPELAALQVRSEQPDEIKLGSPENALEAAKIAAAPIAQSTVTQGKKVASAAQASWHKVKPRAQMATLAATDSTRHILQSKNGRRAALLGVAIIVLLAILIAHSHFTSAQKNKTFGAYQTQYQGFLQAQTVLAEGDRNTAATLLTTVSGRLSTLQSDKYIINSKLTTSKDLPTNEPRTFADFLNLVASTTDQANGLVRIKPITIANLGTNAKPEHFEVSDGNAYIFDAANNNKLTIVNLQSGTKYPSTANTGELGTVVSTTLSSANEGIYILTAKPSLWLYSFNTDTLTQESIVSGKWPAAAEIASYASNIYFLETNGVFKSERAGYGFAAASKYVNTTTNKSKSPSGLAVDGSIYVTSGTTLSRYSGGSNESSAPSPSSLLDVGNLRSTANGTVIIGTSQQSNKIGLWLTSASKLLFDKQIALNAATRIYDATYDQKTGNIFATVDNKLVRLPVQL